MPEDNNRESLAIKELAEAKKAEAEAEAVLIRAKAEADKNRAEMRLKTAEAELAEIKLEQERRKELEELALNKYHYTYSFDNTVTDSTVESCMRQLDIWTRTAPQCRIEIVFSSPGGGVLAGFALFDYIRYIETKGHHITTMALGVAASMAGILLQAGNTRAMGKEAWVLIHEASFGAVGKIGEVEDTVEWVKRVQKRILNIFAERSKLSAKQIGRRWKRKDWWLSSDECLKLGFIDEIR